VFAIALCIFLLCTLETFLSGINRGLDSAKGTRLITRHNVSLVFPLPRAYKERIAGIPGVKMVAGSNWFGGTYIDRKNFFPNFAIDAEEYFQIYPEYLLDPEQKREFMGDLRGCVLGPATAEKFGWKIGDVFQMESFIPTYRKDSPFEFVVQAIYKVDTGRNPGWPENMMFFHYKYLYESMGQRVGNGTCNVEVADPEYAPSVAKAIDDLFENSDTQTRTETEAAFRAGFIKMLGNYALLLRGIGLAVTFTILIVTANTMSMAIRERKTEIGILKTLGFSNGQVLRIILLEAGLLGTLGGLLGVLGGWQMIAKLESIPGLGEMVRGFQLRLPPELAFIGLGIAVAIGLGAGLVPAILSHRARVTSLLRQV
jgi:putative ABC transport system permease protein